MLRSFWERFLRISETFCGLRGVLRTHRGRKSFAMILQKVEAEHMALAICGVCNVELGGTCCAVTVLCCAVLCCAVLCCDCAVTVLCCAVLCRDCVTLERVFMSIVDYDSTAVITV